MKARSSTPSALSRVRPGRRGRKAAERDDDDNLSPFSMKDSYFSDFSTSSYPELGTVSVSLFLGWLVVGGWFLVCWRTFWTCFH